MPGSLPVAVAGVMGGANSEIMDDTKTVGENIKMAFGPIAEKVARFNQIGEEMANPDADFDALMEEMGKLQNDIDAANGWDLDSQLEQAMDALQCPDPDTPVSVCSGGERRRVALCKLLLEAPDLLLLDEHTAALDPRTAAKVLDLSDLIVQEHGLTTLMITHNMKDAIAHGNRLIMMHEGHIIYDVSGEEKKNLQVSDLLAKFQIASGGEFANDRMILS